MDRIKNTELFLASSSPRRKELLAKLGIPFKVAAFDADEKVPDGMTAESAVEYLACLKARCAAERVNGIVIGADTVVEKDGHIMGKPDGKDDAFRMLSTLSGSEHNVHTGVCVLETESGRCICGHETTRVFFDELTPDEINRYIETGETCDKAGAYGIQGEGGKFVRRIEGDYYSVVGLPLNMLYRMLKEIITDGG
ncbi:MAG: Maf family protein [Firmicutes bacterium]|nr:Maf family protein [Bacillota bacterium]